MLIIEYRIPLPLTLEEYELAFPYSVNRCSELTTGRSGNPRDEGVEMLLNEPWIDEKSGLPGKHRKKVMHVAARAPGWVRKMVSDNYFMVDEESWVTAEGAETQYKFKLLERMSCKVLTKHAADPGTTENIHGLTPEQMKKRKIEFLDIATDTLDAKLYKPEEDPLLVHSEKLNRGPLASGWMSTAEPMMCVYKVVMVDVPVFGVQSMVEKTVQRIAFRDVFLQLHRQLFCWMDDWCDLTPEDLQKIEEEALRKSEEIFGKRDGDGNIVLPIAKEKNENGECALNSLSISPADVPSDAKSDGSTPKSPVIKE